MPKSKVVSSDIDRGSSKIVSFYCPNELLEPLRKMAFYTRTSRSKIIVEALEEYMDYLSRIYPDFSEEQDECH